ncbi:hypothetical protein PV729_26520 [Streptomyces europaeiscabiei]|uniref:Minor tail protein n=1 Tax=Streptomyces europaeiscabiei TaxID=146819 RepID=A0ABU4NRN9_9ACTN|nr:hypothetical protein [Streptomyces europaeiscabiei]MDX3555277.1 hypothetical protein [Streptomyces europaeiscabiei]MDX3705291.1 hypothetical protein [Streptomyces europaeiscabiei]
MVDVFPHRLVTKAEFAFGADPAGDPGTWTWTDVTARRQAQSITITRGRLNEGAQSQTGSITLTLDNLDGALTPDQATSPYFPHVVEGTPIRFSLQWDGVWYTLFFGEVASWEPDWPYGDLSNEDTGYVGEARVIVTANGITRRLGQGTKALKDALRRHIQTAGPLRYWPLTDGERAREGSEVAVGSQPVRAIGTAGSFYQGQPNWGRGSMSTWLDNVVELPSSTEGNLSVRVTPLTLTSWTADHYRAGEGGIEDDFTVFDSGQGTDANPLLAWIITTDRVADTLVLRVLSSGDTTSSIGTVTTINDPGIFDVDPHMIRLTATANSGSTDWELVIDGQSVGSGTYAVPHRPVTRFRYRWGAFASMANPMALGHITYWGANPPSAVSTWRAVQGYNRELSGRRIERLCAEENVPLLVNGNLDHTLAMGPQKPGVFLDLLQSAADVDGGMLYEARDTAALAYRTRRSKYNQGV